MRMMMKVSMPVNQSSKALKEGMLQKVVMGFVETAKPEATYFTTENGKRTGLLFFEMNDSKLMPTLAEPFFQTLDAEVTFTPVMDLSDMKAGIDKAAKII